MHHHTWPFIISVYNVGSGESKSGLHASNCRLKHLPNTGFLVDAQFVIMISKFHFFLMISHAVYILSIQPPIKVRF